MNSAPKYSVLVNDDQSNWRDLLADMLSEEFDVKVSRNYEEALNLVRDQYPPFHVVVTDMRLKDEESGNEDGLRLAKALNKRGDETNVIIVTGYATIDTVRKAFSSLKVYDYLEKRPADGKSFDPGRFQKIVYQAAEEAEIRRPHSFTDVLRQILILVSDPVLSDILAKNLRKDGFQVDALRSLEDWQAQLENFRHEYALILVSETIGDDESLAQLQSLYPKAKIILHTNKDIRNILNAMHEYPVLTAFATPNAQFNALEFRDLIHSAFSSDSVKYVVLEVEPQSAPGTLIEDGANLVVNKTCKVKLSIQNDPAPGALRIFLTPQGQKRGKFQLRLFVHADQMQLELGTEGHWDIPLSGKRPSSYEFWITPRIETDDAALMIELDQNGHWLGRIFRMFKVVNAQEH